LFGDETGCDIHFELLPSFGLSLRVTCLSVFSVLTWLCPLSPTLRIDRKKDKAERKILDSQERAFWDVHRPVVS
jgi:hypothetical protein